jgi:hypothetical protein
MTMIQLETVCANIPHEKVDQPHYSISSCLKDTEIPRLKFKYTEILVRLAHLRQYFIQQENTPSQNY